MSSPETTESAPGQRVSKGTNARIVSTAAIARDTSDVEDGQSNPACDGVSPALETCAEPNAVPTSRARGCAVARSFQRSSGPAPFHPNGKPSTRNYNTGRYEDDAGEEVRSKRVQKASQCASLDQAKRAKKASQCASLNQAKPATCKFTTEQMRKGKELYEMYLRGQAPVSLQNAIALQRTGAGTPSPAAYAAHLISNQLAALKDDGGIDIDTATAIKESWSNYMLADMNEDRERAASVALRDAINPRHGSPTTRIRAFKTALAYMQKIRTTEAQRLQVSVAAVREMMEGKPFETTLSDHHRKALTGPNVPSTMLKLFALGYLETVKVNLFPNWCTTVVDEVKTSRKCGPHEKLFVCILSGNKYDEAAVQTMPRALRDFFICDLMRQYESDELFQPFFLIEAALRSPEVLDK